MEVSELAASWAAEVGEYVRALRPSLGLCRLFPGPGLLCPFIHLSLLACYFRTLRFCSTSPQPYLARNNPKSPALGDSRPGSNIPTPPGHHVDDQRAALTPTTSHQSIWTPRAHRCETARMSVELSPPELGFKRASIPGLLQRPAKLLTIRTQAPSPTRSARFCDCITTTAIPSHSRSRLQLRNSMCRLQHFAYIA